MSIPFPTGSLWLASPDVSISSSNVALTPGQQEAPHQFYVLFLLFQLGSAAAFSSAGRSCGERESWGDF